MKKSVAAKMYWFNYTARRRHEEQMRRENMTLNRKFTHGLTKAYTSLKVIWLNFLLKLQWYFRQWVAKCQK
jgi:hypothetical protein